MKRIIMGSVIVLTLALSVQTVIAETVTIPSKSSSMSIEIPPRGMTMTSVEEHFGEPESKNEPIGEPPITVWQYSTYTVYFERQYVIHTVVNKS